MGVTTEGATIVDVPDNGSTARLFADVSTPPGRPSNTGQSQPPRADDGYLRDLWGVTGNAANLEGHTEHPDFPAGSAGSIHSSPNTVLHPRDEAARFNAESLAENPSHNIPPYHPDRAIISYRTDMETDNISRVHGADNKVGPWATRTSDIQNAAGEYVSGSEARKILATPGTPTDVSLVHPPVGTDVLASRPISDDARQYQLLTLAQSWFGNSTKLG